MEPASTPPPKATCAVCTIQNAKYTCPRCALKSCSLSCSNTHKQQTGCTGIRNKVEYVPMNAYGYGTLMNDYVFLEEVGRKTEEWGRKIAKDGIARGSGNARAGRARGRGGHGRGAIGQKMDRRAYLAMQLSFRDVDMEVLPLGMERTKRNQSHWDSKSKTAQFTIEFTLHPTASPLTPQEGKPDPVVLKTHKNDWSKSIRALIHSHLKGTSKLRKDPVLSDRIEALVGSKVDDDSITEPLVVMQCPRSQDPNEGLSSRRTYYKLDWNDKLSSTLRHKSFVEFPCIEILEESCLDGVLLDDDGTLTSVAPRRKRRKLDSSVGKKAIVGLIGDYGSEDEEAEEDDNALNGLGDYEDDDGIENEGSGSEDHDAENALELEPSADYAGLSMPAPYSRDIDDDPELDWGDMDEELAEDEAKLASLDASIRQRAAT
ncbi:hypothetical protein SCHPADRAFT_861836 [Schizopora paradoxa]|uniref:HIT-type domain-containing protein n=1 Tax=Schizopora paradoxa TaxID=27342 RepID=A0A0H2RMA2_9AGAM|nr:hypothetical protein SCHPADRAFT_861836 [Schizopora paradoxa]